LKEAWETTIIFGGLELKIATTPYRILHPDKYQGVIGTPESFMPLARGALKMKIERFSRPMRRK
jgi:hypothetical protein